MNELKEKWENLLQFADLFVPLHEENQNNKNTMAKKTAKETNPKRVAYEKKQEQQGEKVIKWIIGVLIALAMCYAAYSIWLVA